MPPAILEGGRVPVPGERMAASTTDGKAHARLCFKKTGQPEKLGRWNSPGMLAASATDQVGNRGGAKEGMHVNFCYLI